jgi:hypothetical protein
MEFDMFLFNQFTRSTQNNYACCRCRIATKEPAQSNKNTTACPHCGRSMYDMGAGFIPPRKSDKDEWQKVALLVKHHFTFEYLPATAK